MLRRMLLALVCALFALPLIGQAQEATPEPATEEAGLGLQRYVGEGFSLLVPANATIGITETGQVQITGPDIAVSPAGETSEVVGPAYQMSLEVFDNPEGLDAETWAREQIAAQFQAAQDAGEPTGTLPVNEEGELDEEAVVRTTVAGQPAFRVNFFGGDSYIPNIYVASVGEDNRILVFSYVENIEENVPVAIVQRDIYSLILGTLRFDDPLDEITVG